jgi:hypothetical protein
LDARERRVIDDLVCLYCDAADTGSAVAPMVGVLLATRRDEVIALRADREFLPPALQKLRVQLAELNKELRAIK